MDKILESILVNNRHASIIPTWRLHIIEEFRHRGEHSCDCVNLFLRSLWHWHYLPESPQRRSMCKRVLMPAQPACLPCLGLSQLSKRGGLMRSKASEHLTRILPFLGNRYQYAWLEG